MTPEEQAAADAAAAAAKPDWLLPKFETPEAQAKAYADAEREMGRMRSQMETERAQFASALEAIPTVTTPTGGDQQTFDPTLAAYTQAYESGDTAAMLRLSSEFAAKQIIDPITKAFDERLGQLQPALDAQAVAQRESQIRMAEDVVARQIGVEEYKRLLPSISTMIQERPNYLPAVGNVEGYAAAILDVAKLANHETLTKSVADLEAELAEKRAAQTLTGAGAGRSVYTPDQQKAEFERIKAVNLGSYAQVVGGSGS